MNPLFLVVIQMLQAFGMLTIFQNFLIAIFGLALLFATISYFWKRGG